MLRSVLSLKRYSIGAVDGEIGKVEDLYFDDSEWVVRYLVADTGKWLPGRLVLISPSALGRPDWVTGVLPVSLTKEEVEKSPPVEMDKPVSRQREAEVVKYYGWPVYWTPPMVPAAGPVVPPASVSGPSRPESGRAPTGDAPGGRSYDPHLRSARKVIGYHVQAIDGRIGHVEDFILNDEAWTIQYLVIDTRNWWPGRKVLMLPMYVLGVSWDTSVVRVNAPRETIANGPTYDPSAPIIREYELAVRDYYGRPRGQHTTKEGARGIASAVMSAAPPKEKEAKSMKE